MSDAAATPQKFGAINPFGTLLSTTWRHLLAVWLLGAVAMILFYLLLAVVFGVVIFGVVEVSGLKPFEALKWAFSDRTSSATPLEFAVFVGFTAMIIGIAVFISGPLFGVLLQIALNLIRSGRLSLGKAMSVCRACWSHLGLANLLYFAFLVVLGVALRWIPAQVNENLMGIANLVFYVAVFYFGCVFTPLSAVVLEGHKVLSAFRRSALLTQGNRLAIIVYWLIISVGLYVISSLLIMPLFAAVFVFGFVPFGQDIMTMIVIYLLTYLVLALATGIFVLATGLVYTSLLALEARGDGEQQAVD